MRSILLHLKNTTQAEVTAHLDQECRHRSLSGRNKQWSWCTEEEPVLYIGFINAAQDLGAEDLEIVRQALGSEPSVTIAVDVSGQSGGDAEVPDFISYVLLAFEGVAQDDYTSHVWYLDEILSEVQKEGHPFFDYLGWHKAEV